MGSWHEKVGFHSFIHHPPARLQVFFIYRAQLLPDGIYYNVPQLLQYIPGIFRHWSLVCGAILPRRLQVTGLHKRSAHRTSIFGPKTRVPDAGLRLWGRAVALAGLHRSGRIHRPYVSARPRGGHACALARTTGACACVPAHT